MERWEDLCEAIDSLHRQTRRPDQIVLVIDHNDALLARATEMRWPDVVVVPNQRERGLSGARNTGIAAAEGGVLAFLDDDTVADPDWLACLVRHIAAPDVLGCTSRINPHWLGTRPRWFPDEFLWTVGCSYRGLPTETREIRNVLGAAMLIRRTVFDAAGGFSSILGRSAGSLVSCEETEMCLRASAVFPQGRFLMVPDARVRHKVPATRLTWRYFRRRCFAEGQSKAYIANLVRRRSALDTERDYVLRTLASGVLRGIADTALRFDPGGVARASAILFGLAATACGYLEGKLRRRRVAASEPLRGKVAE